MSKSVVFRLLVCVGLLSVSGFVQGAITTPYFNDFSASEPFTETGATWSLNTGAGTYTNTFSSNGTSSSATDTVTGLGGIASPTKSFVMSSKFTITANANGSGVNVNANNTVGFAALSTNAGPTTNWLLADIATNGTTDGQIRLLRFHDATNTPVNPVAVPFTSPLVTGTEYTMTLTGNYSPTGDLGLVFSLFDGIAQLATVSGTVSAANVTANLQGNYFGLRNRTNANTTFAVAFNDFSITTPIPEPTTWAAGVAALGFLWWRRRKA